MCVVKCSLLLCALLCLVYGCLELRDFCDVVGIENRGPQGRERLYI
jgi:hypothetical protein